MKADNSNWSLNVGAANQALLIRSEAEIQGLDTSKILWECASCYGNKLITDNAETFEGEVQFLGFLPVRGGVGQQDRRRTSSPT